MAGATAATRSGAIIAGCASAGKGQLTTDRIGKGDLCGNVRRAALRPHCHGPVRHPSAILIHNWRTGAAGKGQWDMVRRLSGAVAVRRCYTRLNAPTVTSNSGIAAGDIAKAYDIDWALIGMVGASGSKVTFTAAHMTPDEFGELSLSSDEEAQTVRDTFALLRDRCRT